MTTSLAQALARSLGPLALALALVEGRAVGAAGPYPEVVLETLLEAAGDLVPQGSTGVLVATPRRVWFQAGPIPKGPWVEVEGLEASSP